MFVQFGSSVLLFDQLVRQHLHYKQVLSSCLVHACCGLYEHLWVAIMHGIVFYVLSCITVITREPHCVQCHEARFSDLGNVFCPTLMYYEVDIVLWERLDALYIYRYINILLNREGVCFCIFCQLQLIFSGWKPRTLSGSPADCIYFQSIFSLKSSGVM